MLLFLTDLVKHPIQTGSQVYESFATLSGLVKAGDWETVGGALSPEVYELITQWETLPDSKKGELAGYAFGKHGADILLPGAAAKVVFKWNQIIPNFVIFLVISNALVWNYWVETHPGFRALIAMLGCALIFKSIGPRNILSLMKLLKAEEGEGSNALKSGESDGAARVNEA